MTNAETVYEAQREAADLRSRYEEILWDANPGLGHDAAVEHAYYAWEHKNQDVTAMQDEIGGMVFLIPEENMAELEARLVKLNKRADKLGVDPITLTKLNTEETQITVAPGKFEWVVKQYVAVKGSSPKLAGWQFVATLEHDENGVIIRRIPTFEGEVDLTAYREATPENCDHCHTRRRRNDTYIVRHTGGNMKQVGSNCLTDFLGGANPQHIARWMEFVTQFCDDASDAQDREWFGPNAPKRYDAEEYLTHVACMIREEGWTSRGSAYEYGGTATADRADSNMYNMAHKVRDRQGLALWTEPTPADNDLAAKAISWARDLNETDLENDYLYNLHTSLRGESIPSRQFGIAASAIVAYSKAVEREIKRRQSEQRKATSEHFGEIKERVTFDAEVLRINWIKDNYSYDGGMKPLYIFTTTDGNEAKWFSSKDMGLEVGQKVTVTGTVKAHEDHERFGKSTQVTRCKIEES